ncbi:MAG: glycosyl hydrolase, family 38, partial [Sporolactobacillus laevolacticus]|nr:glycosyl hydrolase, family 38 [Sporolactobacillus laevolacticus]
MVNSYIVNHTHWDREWYFTNMDALVLSEQLFTEVLDELERNSDANFCLDGQSSIIDEYCEIHPEALQRIRKLIKEGRLFVGPWYTQTDAIIADTESILRNLIIGILDTKEKYGDPMMVGYLPDTFGFNAQMPTLLNQVGIDNFIFWRGINFDKQVKSPYFKWKGLGDSEV